MSYFNEIEIDMAAGLPMAFATLVDALDQIVDEPDRFRHATCLFKDAAPEAVAAFTDYTQQMFMKHSIGIVWDDGVQDLHSRDAGLFMVKVKDEMRIPLAIDTTSQNFREQFKHMRLNALEALPQPPLDDLPNLFPNSRFGDPAGPAQ